MPSSLTTASTSAHFYRAFEDKFRGSRKTIKARLQIYRPLLDGLLAHTNNRQAIDLGCGRGEWLEWIRELGFEAAGTDLDPEMLADCRALDLPVQEKDALEVLKSLSPDSIALVSAFHLVEHLPFDQVIELIKQAHRVLMPGGMIIMETPNSENLGVGTWNFYLDPTHQRPIPHLLLEFTTQFGGFAFTKILRVNEQASLADPTAAAAAAAATSAEVALFDVLCRASPDYAVVGIKARDDKKSIKDVFGDFLSQPQGLTLEALANRYDDKFSGAIRTLDADLFALRAEVTSFREAEQKLLQHFANDDNSESGITFEQFARSQQAIIRRLDRLEQTVESQALLASISRRLTKPARFVSRVVARIKRAIERNG